MNDIQEVAKQIASNVEMSGQIAMMMGEEFNNQKRNYMIRNLCHDAVIQGQVDELDFDALYRLAVKG